MNEERAVATFLVAALDASDAVAALAGERIYEGQAPEGVEYPLIVFRLQGGSDTNALGSDVRTLVRLQYLVKAICAGDDYSPADAVMAAVDAALCGARGPVTVADVTYQVQTICREHPVRYLEYVDGVRYNHVGGLYRVPAHRLS